MPLPELVPGLIVRYEYLWSRRASSNDTADKDHPACVVSIFQHPQNKEDFVVYLPISHTPPAEGEEGLELSAPTKSAAGLDKRRQRVLVSECNVDVWPFDLRQIPLRPGQFQYGHLPPKVFAQIADQFLKLYRARRVTQIARGDP